jgi:hypothetical protein
MWMKAPHGKRCVSALVRWINDGRAGRPTTGKFEANARLFLHRLPNRFAASEWPLPKKWIELQSALDDLGIVHADLPEPSTDQSGNGARAAYNRHIRARQEAAAAEKKEQHVAERIAAGEPEIIIFGERLWPRADGDVDTGITLELALPLAYHWRDLDTLLASFNMPVANRARWYATDAKLQGQAHGKGDYSFWHFVSMAMTKNPDGAAATRLPPNIPKERS